MSKLWTPEPEFDKEDLFAFIEEAGLHINDSLLQESQEQGLMLPRRRRFRGRDGSDPGVWTQQQRDLLRSLCHARERQGMHSIALRCNLPVWVWLYWGDNYGVTLKQVKRVMKTWAIRQEKPNGPHDIPLTPEGVGEIFRVRREAVTWLAQGQELPDIYWQWARFFHLHGLSQYLQERPGFASETAGGPVAHLFSPETIESFYTSSCVDLAMVLYIGLLYPDPPNLPEWLRPGYWRRSVKSATLTVRQVISPLALPDGSRSMHLAITGTLWSPGERRDELGQFIPDKRRVRKTTGSRHQKK
jgi:hypothetical protein